MSRTKKGKKKRGYEGYDFWSKRCFGSKSLGHGPFAKKITKRKERAIDRMLEHEARNKSSSNED